MRVFGRNPIITTAFSAIKQTTSGHRRHQNPRATKAPYPAPATEQPDRTPRIRPTNIAATVLAVTRSEMLDMLEYVL